jgi:dihydroorotate dehydrogenase (fumarate)
MDMITRYPGLTLPGPIVASASPLNRDPDTLRALNDGLAAWLSARGLRSSEAIRGRLRHGALADPEAYERANCIKVLQGYRP